MNIFNQVGDLETRIQENYLKITDFDKAQDNLNRSSNKQFGQMTPLKEFEKLVK